MADLINRSNPVLRAMNKRAVSSDAIYLKGKLSSEHNPGTLVDGAAVTVPADSKVTFSNAELPWATYYATFSVPKRLMDEVSANPGTPGRIIQTEIAEAAEDLADKIAADIFAGTIANGLVGLIDILDDANTYAGIDRAVAGNENWQATVVDNQIAGPAPGEISTAALYSLESAFFAKNGYGWRERPGMFTGVTDAAIMDKYSALLESIDLSALSTAHFVNQANATGQLGYGNIGFLGVPFIRDRNLVATGDLASSSRLYFIDMSKIDLCVLTPSPDANVHRLQGFTSAPTVDGINAKIEILGNTGESVQGYVKTYIQLATDNPKAAGAVLKNIAAT